MQRASTYKLKTSAEILLNFEKTIIAIYSASAIFLLIANIYILFLYAQIQPTYAYYFMNVRLNFDYYLIGVSLSTVSKNPENDCRLGDNKLDFAAIEMIMEAELIDVTNTTKLQDPYNKNKLVDIAATKQKYYTFDISKRNPNGTNFPLVNRYTLNNWKGSNICIRNVYFDEWYQGIQLINSNTSCAAKFPNKVPLDCGVYGIPELNDTIDKKERYMRLCVLKDEIYLDSARTLRVSSYPDHPLVLGRNFCPINNFDFLYYENTAFNSSDINSWKYNFRYFVNKENVLNKNVSAYPLDKYESIMNPMEPGVLSLLTIFDNAYFQNYQKYPNPNDTYVFGDYDSATLFPGKEYGINDLVTTDVDTYNFFSIYNDTFYTNSVYDPATDTKSYLPSFLTKSNEIEFIMPSVETGLKYDVTIQQNVCPVFFKSCFSKVFEFNSDILRFFGNLNIQFIEEFVVSSMALCLMAMLLAFYCEVYIRYYVINRIIDGGINYFDKKSEKYTKYCHKVFEFIVMIISTYYQFYNIGLIDTGIYTAKLLLENNCLVIKNPPSGVVGDAALPYMQNLNNLLKYYISFLSDLNFVMKVYLSVLLSNFVCLIVVTLTYVYNNDIEEMIEVPPEVEVLELE